MQSAMYRLNDTDDASKRDVRKITLEQALDENPVSFFQYRILMVNNNLSCELDLPINITPHSPIRDSPHLSHYTILH